MREGGSMAGRPEQPGPTAFAFSCDFLKGSIRDL